MYAKAESNSESSSSELSDIDFLMQMKAEHQSRTNQSRHQRASTRHNDLEKNELFAQELARLQATNGQAKPLWVEEFGSAFPAAQHFLRARCIHQTVLTESTSHARNKDTFKEDPVITKTRQNQAKSRQAMSCKYNKKWTVDQFEKGEVVALKIPSELRTSTDNLRLFCVVVNCLHKNTYKLRCRHGILDRKFPTKNLERVPETVAQGLNILVN